MRKVLLFLFSSAVLPAARADVSLPSLISDNMLLQRSKAFVYGQAAPGEKVKVTLGSVSASTVTGKDGKWRVKLDGLKAGEPGAMTITGKNKIVVKNVAVGDVWVCAGQANMSLPVASASNSQTEITTADSPDIRMFTVTRKSSDDPVAGVEGKWEVCDEASVGHWSATGYFFARQLHDDLELPIGMIHASWPGPGAQSALRSTSVGGKGSRNDWRHSWIGRSMRKLSIIRSAAFGSEPSVRQRAIAARKCSETRSIIISMSVVFS